MRSEKIKKQILIIGILLFCGCTAAHAQFYAVRTNVVELASTTFNVEASMVLNLRWSLHMPVRYNPWTFDGNKKLKNITVSPGVRYWLQETDGYGWYIGGNAIISRYNIGGMLGSKFRYDGMAYGLGGSGGFSLPLTRQFNIEFEAGVGGIYYEHDKYNCPTCGSKIGKETGIFAVPNKLGVNLVYLF